MLDFRVTYFVSVMLLTFTKMAADYCVLVGEPAHSISAVNLNSIKLPVALRVLSCVLVSYRKFYRKHVTMFIGVVGKFNSRNR